MSRDAIRNRIRKILLSGENTAVSKADLPAIRRVARLVCDGKANRMDLVAVSGKALSDRVYKQVEQMERKR